MTKISTYFVAFSMMTSVFAFANTANAHNHDTAKPAVATSTAVTPVAYEYSFDNLHTQILFSVNHAGFSNSHGRFNKFDGGFNFDEKKPTEASVDVTIHTDSLDMADKVWNEHVSAPTFLNVEKYPTIHFKSTKVALTGDKAADVHGDLTIAGVTKPVVLKTVFNQAGVNPFSKKQTVGFSGTTKIKRSDFGVTYGLPAVGDDVSITIEVEATKNEAVNNATGQ